MYYRATGEVVSLSGATNNWTIGGAIGGRRDGTARNDVFYAIGTENLFGYFGDDIYNLYSSTVRVNEVGGSGIDTVNVYYWGGVALADGVENAFLLSGGANWATGNASDNLLVAGIVAATLNGRGGNDVLVGGVGADVFQIGAGNGSDAIYRFTPGWDVIELSGYGITSYASFKADAVQVGRDVVFHLSDSEQLVIHDVVLGSLRPADFDLTRNPRMAQDYTDTLAAGEARTYNGWYAFANAWGVGNRVAGEDFTLNGSFDAKDVTAGITFNWDFAQSTDLYPSILAYPEVIFGHSPLNFFPTAVDRAAVFPIQLSDMISLTAKYDVSYGGNLAGFNVAYDIWFSDSPTATGRAAVSTELMIWVHKGAFSAFGTAIDTFAVNGTTFTVYHSGTYIALVADKDVPSGTLDIAAIVDKLTALGLMSETEYLRSIELGAEVTSGAGWLTINDLDLTAETRSDTGGVITKVVNGSGATTSTTAAATVASVVLADATTAGTSALMDDRGVVVGAKSTAIASDGTATITHRDLAGATTGIEVVRHDATSVVTEHYSATGAFRGVDRGTYLPDGSLSVAHYDANYVLVGTQKISVDSEVVVIDRFDQAGNPIGTDRVVTTKTGIVTEHYDASYAFLGVDKSIWDGTSTSIQHYNASFDLVSVDVVTVNGANTATRHFDSAWHALGGEVATVKANGVVSTIAFDASWNRIDRTLTGTDGDDRLAGNHGISHLHGGGGSDLLRGGAGADYFHFDQLPQGGDVATIRNFGLDLDTIVLSHAVFGDAGSLGALDPAAFATADAVTGATRVIYDAIAGDLFYDADGSGAGAPILLAHIGAGLALAASDFVIG